VDVQQLLTCNTVSSGEQLPQKYATKTISNVLIKTTVKGGNNNNTTIATTAAWGPLIDDDVRGALKHLQHLEARRWRRA